MRSLTDLIGHRIFASDGEVGKADDFYFDDQQWTVRYLVADTGGLLTGRTVLLSPRAVSELDQNGKRINVNLTREQIQNAPAADTAMPVSRELEIEMNHYYGWPHYWTGGFLWGPAMSPAWPMDQVGYPLPNPGAVGAVPAGPVEKPGRPATTPPAAVEENNHLRSTREVTGYAIQAADGGLGTVAGFLIDEDTWQIRALVIDTKPWLPGGEVQVPPGEVAGVDWSRRQVVVDMTREAVKNAAPVDMSRYTDRK